MVRKNFIYKLMSAGHMRVKHLCGRGFKGAFKFLLVGTPDSSCRDVRWPHRLLASRISVRLVVPSLSALTKGSGVLSVAPPADSTKELVTGYTCSY